MSIVLFVISLIVTTYFVHRTWHDDIAQWTARNFEPGMRYLAFAIGFVQVVLLIMDWRLFLAHAFIGSIFQFRKYLQFKRERFWS